MAIVTVKKYSLNALSIELGVPYGSMWNAARRTKMLDSYEREGKSYVIDSRQMRELRRAVNIAELYRIPFDRALAMLNDGFKPPRGKFDIEEGVA